MSELESVRVRLLKSLAGYELWRRAEEGKRKVESEEGVVDILTGLTPREGHFPTHVPLWENDWGDDAEHMDLAVKEARALGQIDYSPPVHHGPFLVGPFIRITPAGMAWLRELDELPKLKPIP